MGPHRGSQDDPATGDKKFQGSKKDDYQHKKNEIKKPFSKVDIKQKETQMRPHRRSQDDPATGDKKYLWCLLYTTIFTAAHNRDNGRTLENINFKVVKTTAAVLLCCRKPSLKFQDPQHRTRSYIILIKFGINILYEWLYPSLCKNIKNMRKFFPCASENFTKNLRSIWL